MNESCISVSEFSIAGFQTINSSKIIFFIIFLFIYCVSFFENLLIIVLSYVSPSLHTPMYFLLSNLSLCEIVAITNIIPRMLYGLLEKNTITFIDCLIHLYVFGIVTSVISLVFTLMSYDRYLAVCNPLRYSGLINIRLCLNLVIGFWLCSCAWISTITYFQTKMKFCCNNIIDHFYCEHVALMNISCSDTRLLNLSVVIISGILTFIPFIIIIFTYILIISAIFKIPSVEGRKKAFSTCSSHLTVVSIYYFTFFVIYSVPGSFSADIKKGLSLVYIVVTPMLNPVIYTLKNKEIHNACRSKIGNLKSLFDM